MRTRIQSSRFYHKLARHESMQKLDEYTATDHSSLKSVPVHPAKGRHSSVVLDQNYKEASVQTYMS